MGSTFPSSPGKPSWGDQDRWGGDEGHAKNPDGKVHHDEELGDPEAAKVNGPHSPYQNPAFRYPKRTLKNSTIVASPARMTRDPTPIPDLPLPPTHVEHPDQRPDQRRQESGHHGRRSSLATPLHGKERGPEQEAEDHGPEHHSPPRACRVPVDLEGENRLPVRGEEPMPMADAEIL